jgi:hypothetical protein
MKVIAHAMGGRVAQGLNGAFRLSLPMDVDLYFGGAPYRMNGMTHLEALGSPLYRVKCATEIQADFDVEVPCQDFGVPTNADMRYAVGQAIEAAFRGRPVFAGCMGGIGRTGTFLAVVLKVFYPKVPVKSLVPMVKRVYFGPAVETEEQYRLIESIDVSALQRRVRWLWLKAVIRRTLWGR